MDRPDMTGTQLRQVEANRQEYGDDYHQLRFIDSDAAAAAAKRRAELLQGPLKGAAMGAQGTKLDMDRLSPGCRKCVEGTWSCLFINGSCNCDCFYCPTSQQELGLPVTNSLTFRHPEDYLFYLERFGFEGSGLSGGEPLLTPGRCIGYLSAMNKRFGDAMHSWLYTNGTLVTEELLKGLRDAGLGEIRFDIGATDYSLKKAELAARYIPTVTVEIPAVPEEAARLKALMPAMRDAGIRHLNLHQLRLTPYNFARLASRGYSFVHGEKVTVLESELCALEVMAHGFDAGIDLPVNYCSFVYKNRHQKIAGRLRSARSIKKGYESLSASGLIRSLVLSAERPLLLALQQRFSESGHDGALWMLDEAKGRLSFHADLLYLVPKGEGRLHVSYAEAALRERASGYHLFQELRLPSGRKMAVERWMRMKETELGPEFRGALLDWLEGGAQTPPVLLADFETVVQGMQDYF